MSRSLCVLFSNSLCVFFFQSCRGDNFAILKQFIFIWWSFSSSSSAQDHVFASLFFFRMLSRLPALRSLLFLPKWFIFLSHLVSSADLCSVSSYKPDTQTHPKTHTHPIALLTAGQTRFFSIHNILSDAVCVCKLWDIGMAVEKTNGINWPKLKELKSRFPFDIRGRTAFKVIQTPFKRHLNVWRMLQTAKCVCVCAIESRAVSDAFFSWNIFKWTSHGKRWGRRSSLNLNVRSFKIRNQNLKFPNDQSTCPVKV